jgi:hypothetical protein
MGLAALMLGIPGEEAVAIGQQQAVCRQIAADGYQAVAAFTSPMRIGEPQLIV